MNSDLIKTVVYSVYYIFVGILALAGLSGAYLLASHGRSRILSLVSCLIFILIFLAVFFASFSALHSIFIVATY